MSDAIYSPLPQAPPDEIEVALEDLFPREQFDRWLCDRPDCDGEPHTDWPQRHARSAQRPPEGDWRAWYVRGGRGSGKTRTGSETFANWVLNNPPGDWAIIAPTYGDARDTCVEGPKSGLLAVMGDHVEMWNRSIGEIRVDNGARIYIDGADDGALRIQGKNLCGAWCDEVGLWRQWRKAWEESIAFAVRIDPARLIATGTPKGRSGIPPLLIADDAVPVTRLRTEDNAANLSEPMLKALRERYAGTRLGRQELEGEILADVEGALWSWDVIEDNRVEEMPYPEWATRMVVAVDPAISNSEDSDETGIIVAAKDRDGHGYVLSDLSLHSTPKGWADVAIGAYHDHQADKIIAEKNQGGDMVETTLHSVDSQVPVKLVWASRGKRTRAEPIAALYEQGKIRHVGAFPELESQLTSWTPEAKHSPDRLDALVWAMTELMLGTVSTSAPVILRSPSKHKIY